MIEFIVEVSYVEDMVDKLPEILHATSDMIFNLFRATSIILVEVDVYWKHPVVMMYFSTSSKSFEGLANNFHISNSASMVFI